MSEGEIHQAFIAYLNKVGVPFRHDRMDKKTTTKKGEPDFAIYHKGGVLFVEVKQLGKKLRPEQVERKAELEAAGCPYKLAYSVEECVHATMVWLGQQNAIQAARSAFTRHFGKPLDCYGACQDKGKADAS